MGGFVASPPPTPEASKDEDDDAMLMLMRMMIPALPVLMRYLLDVLTLCHS